MILLNETMNHQRETKQSEKEKKKQYRTEREERETKKLLREQRRTERREMLNEKKEHITEARRYLKEQKLNLATANQLAKSVNWMADYNLFNWGFDSQGPLHWFFNSHPEAYENGKLKKAFDAVAKEVEKQEKEDKKQKEERVNKAAELWDNIKDVMKDEFDYVM